MAGYEKRSRENLLIRHLGLCRDGPLAALMLMDVAPQTTRELSIEGVPSPYVSDPIWVRGGKAIAFVDRLPQSEHGGRIWIVPAAGGLARPVTDASVQALSPAFTVDEQKKGRPLEPAPT